MKITANEGYLKFRAMEPLCYSKVGGRVVPAGYMCGLAEDGRVAVFYEGSGPRIRVATGESYHIVNDGDVLCYIDMEKAPTLD
jgi:hypothetical protein